MRVGLSRTAVHETNSQLLDHLPHALNSPASMLANQPASQPEAECGRLTNEALGDASAVTACSWRVRINGGLVLGHVSTS